MGDHADFNDNGHTFHLFQVFSGDDFVIKDDDSDDKKGDDN